MQAALTDGAVDDGEDRLFDTLDTVLRRLWLPSGRQAVVSDTVGFISHLPTQLFNAFKVRPACLHSSCSTAPAHPALLCALLSEP